MLFKVHREDLIDAKLEMKAESTREKIPLFQKRTCDNFVLCNALEESPTYLKAVLCHIKALTKYFFTKGTFLKIKKKIMCLHLKKWFLTEVSLIHLHIRDIEKLNIVIVVWF